MSTAVVTASLMLNDGSNVDLYASAMTESTNGITTVELKTSTTYAVAATSLGTFANGKTITLVSQPVTSTNSVAFAYIERRGAILCILPVASRGVQSQPYLPYWTGRIEAGDTIQVCAMALTTRISSYNVITNQGVQAIFSGIDASGNIELLHILSQQSIGSSLTGQQIVRHSGTQCAASSTKNISAGVYVVNDRGLVAGNCPLTATINTPQRMNALGGAAINLNFIARVSSNA
jgi:hypothetical protein